MLAPGDYWFFGFPASHKVSIHDSHSPELQSDDLTTRLGDTEVWDQVNVADLTDKQRALVWIDGRLIENNPTLRRLKELETAERIADRIDSIHISNGLDELINRLVPQRN